MSEKFLLVVAGCVEMKIQHKLMQQICKFVEISGVQFMYVYAVVTPVVLIQKIN